MTNAQAIYDRLPVWSQNLLVSAYGYFQYRRRFGGDYPAVLDEVLRSTRLLSEQVPKVQEERLRRILSVASRHVPYYMTASGALPINAALDESAFRALPILSKAEVQEHAGALRNQQEKAFWINSTSGSTGTPLEVALNRYSYQLSMALLAAHEADYGIFPGAARATFAGRLIQPVWNERLPLWRYNRADNQMLFSTIHLSDRVLPAYLDELCRFCPDEIIGYPSAIYAVAEFCQRTGATPRCHPKVVVTNSETLFDWQRDAISAVFGCPVADYYGTAECLVFASQCSFGRYHFNPLLSIVEILDSNDRPVAPGEQGSLVCTTLTNTVMPLLRYRIGDDAIRAPVGCPCGSNHPAALGIVGRTDDNVITPDGRAVGRLDHIFKGVRGVRECQIVQDRIDHVLLRVLPDGAFDQRTREVLISNLQTRLGQAIAIDIEIVSGISRTRSGKFKGVVSMIKETPPS